MTTLFITNGDTTVDLLQQAGRVGVILPWRDVLHEGPLIAGGLPEMTAVRAPWLAERFRLDPPLVTDPMVERDGIIRDHARFEAIELWFEHDLYDQLQIAQILVALHAAGRTERVDLVQANDFLGHQTPASILRFADDIRAIADADFVAAERVWDALCAPTPAPTLALLSDPALSALPFMADALRRFLAELPGPTDGLGLTERRLVTALAERDRTMAELFRIVIEQESAAFMGDWSFFLLIHDLAQCEQPLIADVPPLEAGGDGPFAAFSAASVRLTETGHAVYAGNRDHLALNTIDRWWAGTRLTGSNIWRYHRHENRLARPPSHDA